MKAYEVAKKLYPALSGMDFIEQTCPDKLQLCDSDKINCNRNKEFVDNECIKCWSQEISKERIKWLMECKKMCKIMGCW